MMVGGDSTVVYGYGDGEPLGSSKIVVTWIKVCVCGADSMKDADHEDLCAPCWLHLRDQVVIDEVLAGVLP